MRPRKLTGIRCWPTASLLGGILLLLPLHTQAQDTSKEDTPAPQQQGNNPDASPSPRLLPEFVRKCDTRPNQNVFDYRDMSAQARQWKVLVEQAHFTDSIKRGIKGNTGHIMSDLHYTLNRFPNHPFALSVVAKVQSRPGYTGRTPRGKYYPTTNCFFHKALAFAPGDPQVYHVIALHFHKQKDYPRAEAFYQSAIHNNPANAEVHYNLGLMYMDANQPARALPHAELAYAAGYPMPGLKNRLAKHGIELSQGVSQDGKTELSATN